MHTYALDNFEETLKYYHVTPDLEAITPLENMTDQQLSNYMNDDNARQLLHVTYGLILTAKDEGGHYLFRDEIFDTLHHNEEAYNEALDIHIGKHISKLGL